MDEAVLRFVSNGEYLAFIETTDLDVKLDDIRRRLKEESSDLLPGPFTFLFKNVTITKKQENRLSVRQICSEPDVNNTKSKPVFDLSLRFVGIQDWSDTTIHKPNSSRIQASSEDFKSSTDKVSETKRFAVANEPTCAYYRKNKIELYSISEIHSQRCWLEKERMIFWNAKSQAIQNSKETLNFTKQELVGALEVSWAYRKTELLNIKVSELEIRQERYMNVFHEKYQRSGHSKTSMNLLDPSPQVFKYKEEISKSLHFIEKGHKKLLDLQVSSAEVLQEVKDAENGIHEHLHQLKRSSDYLFKTLSVLEKRLDTFESQHINCTDSFDVPDLDTSEIVELAKDILNAD